MSVFNFDPDASDEELAEVYARFILGPEPQRRCRKYYTYVRPAGPCSLPCSLPPSWTRHGVVGIETASYDEAFRWVVAALLDDRLVFHPYSLRSWAGCSGTLADIRRKGEAEMRATVYFREGA